MSTESTSQIEEAASEWLIRRDSGNWTADDENRLEQWLNESTLHRMAFWRLELAWEDAARLKALGAGVRSRRPPPPGEWSLTPFFSAPSSQKFTESKDSGLATAVVADNSLVPSRDDSRIKVLAATTTRERNEVRARNRSWHLVGFAASIALAVGAILLYLWTGDRYSTPVGGIASVPMTDGSKVTLNTNSQIRVMFTETERRIDLKQGEAYFEVAKDPGRPFIVQAGDRQVVAVGTQFSVRREPHDIQVIVSEGKVKLESGKTPEKGTARDPGSAEILTPGTIVRVNGRGILIQRRTLPEVDERLSWRGGVLMFRNATLTDAVAEFNRYNLRQIVIEDPAVGALKIEGNFRSTNVDSFVGLLEGGFPIRARQEADQVILVAK